MYCQSFPNPPGATDCTNPWKALGPTGPTGDAGLPSQPPILPQLISATPYSEEVSCKFLVTGEYSPFYSTSAFPLNPLVEFGTESTPAGYQLLYVMAKVPLVSLVVTWIGGSDWKVQLGNGNGETYQILSQDPTSIPNPGVVTVGIKGLLRSVNTIMTSYQGTYRSILVEGIKVYLSAVAVNDYESAEFTFQFYPMLY